MVLRFRRPSVVPNQYLMFVLAWFVDKALFDTILQCEAIL